MRIDKKFEQMKKMQEMQQLAQPQQTQAGQATQTSPAENLFTDPTKNNENKQGFNPADYSDFTQGMESNMDFDSLSGLLDQMDVENEMFENMQNGESLPQKNFFQGSNPTKNKGIELPEFDFSQAGSASSNVFENRFDNSFNQPNSDTASDKTSSSGVESPPEKTNPFDSAQTNINKENNNENNSKTDVSQELSKSEFEELKKKKTQEIYNVT